MADAPRIWRSLRRDPGAMLALAVVGAIVMLVWTGPLIWRLDPMQIDIAARNQGFGTAHPLGTDQLGRDLLARLIAGGRISLAMGMTITVIAMGLGTVLGVSAGWWRRLDAPLMRLTELFLALPLLPLLLLALALFREPLARGLGPAAGSFALMAVIVGVTSWMQTARLLRAEVLALRQREFIMAARAMGAGPVHMIRRHVMPNLASTLIVAATLGLAQAIMLESALSFLGMGFPPDYPTWGRMLHDAVDQMALYPMRALLPGAMISVTLVAVNVLGEGLRDALDPRSSG